MTEADLHAFVDGLLPAARRADVEAYLSRNAQALSSVEGWRAQNLALRQLLDPVRDEPLPLRLPVSRQRSAMQSRWPWRSIAASVAIAVVSAGSGWTLRGASVEHAGRVATTPGVDLARQANADATVGPGLQGFAHRAAVAHAVYSPEVRRPVEVGANQEQGLVTWLTNRMGVEIRPPDLRALGYTLMGGRLLPGDREPVAQFMFTGPQAARLTLYVTREAAGRETAFQFGRDGAVNVFYWVDEDVGYAVSSSAGRQEMLRVAEAVYGQLKTR